MHELQTTHTTRPHQRDSAKQLAKIFGLECVRTAQNNNKQFRSVTIYSEMCAVVNCKYTQGRANTKTCRFVKELSMTNHTRKTSTKIKLLHRFKQKHFPFISPRFPPKTAYLKQRTAKYISMGKRE